MQIKFSNTNFMIKCHKGKSIQFFFYKPFFFVWNQSSIYTFYTHKRVKKKFSLFFRQKMRTFDPHFRHSFLHLKRIEEVTQCPKNGKNHSIRNGLSLQFGGILNLFFSSFKGGRRTVMFFNISAAKSRNSSEATSLAFLELKFSDTI